MSTKINLKLLKYNRQFILGPRFLIEFKNWNKRKILEKLYLTSHPDLDIFSTKYENKIIILLGYILDPYNPNWDNRRIIDYLVKKKNMCNNIFDYIGRYGGRWIMIFLDKSSGKNYIFNDTAGLRQICYTNNRIKEFWAASQPSLLKRVLNLEISEEAKAFIRFIKNNKNNLVSHWWPGISSLFDEINYIIPNHYLDIEKRSLERMEYRNKVDKVKLKEGSIKAAQIIKNLIMAASNRFELSLSLSAGWDSRLLFAASKDIIDDLFIYTILGGGALNKKSIDFIIPFLLCKKFGLKHHILKTKNKVDKEFKELYLTNVFLSSNKRLKLAWNLFKNYPKNRVAIKGNVGEITRNFYIPVNNKKYISSMRYALKLWGNHPYSTKFITKWFKKAKKFAEKKNLKISDLYYWENRMGKWQAMSQLEWDIAQEVLIPYNCRDLLFLMLSIKDKYRVNPSNTLYKIIISSLWRETLKIPINPPKYKKEKYENIIRYWAHKSKILYFFLMLLKPILKLLLNLIFDNMISKQYKELLQKYREN